jgi:hypothetical protein
MAAAPNDVEFQQALAASLVSHEKENGEELELAIALSVTEHENLEKEQQAKRLQELQEEATLAFLEREHAQKRKAEEEATQLLFAQEQEQEQHLQSEVLALFLTANPEAKMDDEYFEQRAVIKKMLRHVSLEQQVQYVQTLAPILNSPAVSGEYANGGAGLAVEALTDAHKYTCTFIREGISVLRAIDDILRPIDLSLNPNMPPQAVLAEIKSVLQAEPVHVQIIQHITTSINNVIAAANPVDIAETGAHVQQLLSRTWTLAKILGPDYTRAIASALSDNIADAGGCIPGLVARLYPIYAKMIHNLLVLSIEEQVPTVSMHYSAGSK